MPQAAPRPCTKTGCGALVEDGTGRCPKHPHPAWAKRANAPKRTRGRRLQTERHHLFMHNPLCVECIKQGRVSAATQRDHVVPLAEGGTDTSDNTQALCDACHAIKSEAEKQRGIARAGRGG